MFSVALILIALAIAYFHYVQGFFSAALSLIAAVFAVCVAFGFMPQVASYLVNAKMPDCAYGVALAGLFAFAYIAQRLIVDGLVPGNIRVNLIADKAGAAICGLLVGGIAAGMIATVAESLPLAPSILGYARAELNPSRHVVGFGKYDRQLDYNINDELHNPTIDESAPTTMTIPFDDAVVGLASHASAGSLAGAVQWSDMFPDYLDEVFANRLGVQVGAAHSAVNNKKGTAVSVAGLYTVPKLNQVDEDIAGYHDTAPPATLTPGPGQMILIVRAKISNANNDADEDRLVRFAMASVRLEINDADYFPVGTLQGTGTIFYDRADDPLFLDLSNGQGGVDLVFLIDEKDVRDKHLSNGSFLVFKRFARIDLSGSVGTIGTEIPSPESDHIGVVRKPHVMQSAVVNKALTEASEQTPATTESTDTGAK